MKPENNARLNDLLVQYSRESYNFFGIDEYKRLFYRLQYDVRDML